MKCVGLSLALLGAILMSVDVANAQAPSWSPPPESQRCPSRWGANDERGSANHMKPQRVLDAVKLIKTGEVIELGHVLNNKMPFPGGRTFELHTLRTLMNQPSNRRGSNEEIVTTALGQVGTQFDAFSHQTHENSLYNCFKLDDIATRNGFLKLGVQNAGAIITRGVLIDVAGLKGFETLPDTYEITVQDLEDALKRQNTSIQPGDAVIINTGWGKLWGKDNARFVKTCPGIGVKAAEWLIAKDPILLGSDNHPVEVSPNPDPQLSLPVHQIALVVHGVHLLENMKLDELVQKGANEFAFILEPLKIQGGTGSTVAPIAIH